MTKTTKTRNNKTNAVYGRTLDGIRFAKDNPLMQELDIKDEVKLEYCEVTRQKHPINAFYPVTGSTEKVRRVCREAWDCRVTDPDTGERVSANGTKKYDTLVRIELNLEDALTSEDKACLQL
tara:strand:+ start:474 stop:839 length:366 start_codon:yes stop_codon:yes gene_type:complete